MVLQFEMTKFRDFIDKSNWPKWDTALVGDDVDERGKAAKEFIKTQVNEVHEFVYEPDEMSIIFDGEKKQITDFHQVFSPLSEKRCLLETTTLGVPEILLATRFFFDSVKKPNISYVYFEPKHYQRPKRSELLSKRDFELTKEFLGFKGIPGFTCPLDGPIQDLVVFMVGYEGNRLASAIDSLYIDGKLCHVIFGVPAFQAGWEMDSFANNIRVIHSENIRYGISFCGADNPRATFELLEKLYVAKEKRNNSFFVAPIGTKPNAIGVALFCCIHEDISVLYDHPKRREGRSKDLGAAHIYQVKVS